MSKPKRFLGMYFTKLSYRRSFVLGFIEIFAGIVRILTLGTVSTEWSLVFLMKTLYPVKGNDVWKEGSDVRKNRPVS